MKFNLLMVCRPEAADPVFIIPVLRQSLEDNFNQFSQDEVSFFVRPTLYRLVLPFTDEGGGVLERALFGFEVDLPDDTSSLDNVITQLTAALTDAEEVDHVLKFYDELLLNHNIARMVELFTLEMRLREALSVIYLAAYNSEYYNLLRNDQLRLPEKGKPDSQEMQRVCENEFFHLLFGQYGTLNQPRSMKDTAALIDLIRQADDFETLRREIQRTPVEEENDAGFIVSLKENLDPIEKVRNSVAHNRVPSRTALENYEKSLRFLSEAADVFLGLFDPSSNQG